MRHLGCICAVILCMTLPGSLVHAGDPNYAEVFFVPEQGFIRVHALFSLPENLELIEFALFPNAQVTTLWIPGLTTYEVDRTHSRTVVTVSMEPGQPNGTLELSYEGFLPNYDLLPDKTLNRSLKWFPEFTQKLGQEYRIRITLPQEHVPKMNGELVEERQSTFSTYTWLLVNQSYPVIWFGDHAPADIAAEWELDQSGLEPTDPDQDLDQDQVQDEDQDQGEDSDQVGVPITPPMVDLEPIEPDTPVELPTESEIELPPELPSDPTSSQTDTTAKTGETDPALAELTDALREFSQALADRDRDLLDLLLDKDFPDRRQFIDYLVNWPETDNHIASQLVEVELNLPTASVYAEIYVGQILNSKAKITWHKQGEAWLIQSFVQIPAGYQFIERIEDPVLHQCIGELTNALTDLDLAWLDYHLQAGAKVPTISFLQQLQGEIEWTAVAADVDHHQVVFLVQTSTGLSLRMQFGYYRHHLGWRIKDFIAIPSADK